MVNYDVGSRDERKGRTGFAHLFEHMMFKGSENVGQNEHPYLMFMNGGSMNGTTNKDRTMYYEVLPANQLDLALFLEADRMRSLAITKDNLENQRNAVQEERRLGVDNQPYGRTVRSARRAGLRELRLRALGDRLDGRSQRGDGGGRLGVLQDLLRAEQRGRGDRRRRRHQDGAGQGREVLRADPAQPPPPEVDMTEPAQTAERRLTLEDGLARLPRLDMAYKIPDSSSPDTDALTVLSTILSGGRSSRFYEGIVRQKQLATQVNSFASGDSRSGSVQHHRDRRARQAADRHRGGDRRRDRAREERTDRGLGAGEGAHRCAAEPGRLARELAAARDPAVAVRACSTTIPERINTRAERIAKVTAADVQRVAQRYLVKTGRTVVQTVPKGAEPAGGL